MSGMGSGLSAILKDEDTEHATTEVKVWTQKRGCTMTRLQPGPSTLPLQLLTPVLLPLPQLNSGYRSHRAQVRQQCSGVK